MNASSRDDSDDARLKVSRYLIASDRRYVDDSGQEVRLLFSGRTGKLAAVDANSVEELLCGEIRLDPERIAELRDAQLLVPHDEDELPALIARNERACSADSLLNYVLIPTNFCNMGCSYCGQSHSKAPPIDGWERSVIAHVEEGILRPTTRRVQIGWFGGEPMTGYPRLMRVSRYLTEVADRVGVEYRADMTTNGSLLTVEKLIELYTVARVSEVVVTVDGPAEFHDRRRILKSGGKSFEHIMGVLSEALSHPRMPELKLRLRTNIDAKNRHAIDDYLNEMKRRGFAHPRVVLDFSPVYAWSNDVSDVELERREYADDEARWMLTMLRLGFHFMILPARPRPVACVAKHAASSVISATGSVFSCTEHVLVPIHEKNDAVGSLADPPGKRRRLGLFHDFDQRVARGEVPCTGCPFFGVCGGACPKHWAENDPPCPSFKFNIQDRLDLQALVLGYR